MADRYLYFILPGLIGGVLLWGHQVMSEPRFALFDSSHAAALSRGLAAAGAVVLLGFAWHSHARAAIWRSSAFLLADSARNYPQGVSAHLLRAKRAAQQGDVDAVVANVRAAVDRGYLRFQQLDSDPALARVREHPKFQAVVRDIALMRIERFAAKTNPTQLELRTVARAYAIRGEVREAIEVLQRALDVGGPKDAETRADLAELRKYL
jgi:tetratricopeptide (TPR) repeat protein